MIYRLLYRLALAHIDAERAHRAAVRALAAVAAIGPLRRGLAALLRPRDPALRVDALGRTLPSPLALAAGFDKDATAFPALLSVGFGAAEVGTITARPQPGNPRPRVFRLARERALVNSMGFPSEGADAAAARLAARDRQAGVVGVNVGRTRAAADATADCRACVARLAAHADYLVLNVSSPNTPGLRDLQAVDRLAELIAAARAGIEDAFRAHAGGGPDSPPGSADVAASPAGAPGADRRVPLLVKIAPDLSDEAVDAIAELALRERLDGLIATNTTVDRGCLRDPSSPDDPGVGGISGAPLRPRALAVLRRLRARTQGRVTLISAGGVETAADVWERIRAGATVVQAYTGYVYGGPLWPWRVNRELARMARAAGYGRVQDAVGADA